jgi:hypothetical protein
MVVDAMAYAITQATNSREKARRHDLYSVRWAQLIGDVLHYERHANDFRAYILAHMTEEPWLPMEGEDDA